MSSQSEEISAGGIIVRKQNNLWQVLLIRDMNNIWTFPKGFIEKGEDKETAARREIAEETGLTHVLHLLTSFPPVHYSFKRSDIHVDKTVYYFLFHYEGDEAPNAQKEEGISTATWVNLPDVSSMIGYPQTNQCLIEESKRYLDHQETYICTTSK